MPLLPKTGSLCSPRGDWIETRARSRRDGGKDAHLLTEVLRELAASGCEMDHLTHEEEVQRRLEQMSIALMNFAYVV